MATIHLEEVTRSYVAGATAPNGHSDFEEGSIIKEVSDDRERSDIPALNRITLTIPNGRTVAILGPSGCGKSTLLRVIAGLDRSYDGAVFYDGRDMQDVPPRERYMGMVFQGYALYPHFHGYKNLRFQFLVRKAPDKEANERIRVTSDMMGYGFRDLLGRKPGTLSGGEQQRLALARAIVRKPDILLMDEPLSNLDAQLRSKTRVEMKKLLRQFEITAVYVTHDQTEAISLADLIAVMYRGKIAQIGTYEQIRSRPANTFVAGFLGLHPLNLLPATVWNDNYVRIGNLQMEPVRGFVLKRHIGEQVIAGVQPEYLKVLSRSDVQNEQGMLMGEVVVIEPDFAQKLQYVRLETGLGTITATAEMDRSLAHGQMVAIVSNGGQAQLFHKVDGHNLLNSI